MANGLAALAAAVRAGRLVGTNGPVIEAAIVAPSGARLAPGTAVLVPGEGAVLEVAVRAAPWIPVAELRIVVNGAVVRRLELPDHTHAPLQRFRGTFPLDALLPAGGRDSWVVVEAGEPLQLSADLDGDGIPDTGDNDGNGVVDRRDLEPGKDSGPLADPPIPQDPADERFDFAAVSGGALPQAFTNPFLLDRDGDGQFAGPGLPGAAP